LQINPDTNVSAYTIRSYAPGKIVVYIPETDKAQVLKNSENQVEDNTLILTNNFIVSPNNLIIDWANTTAHSLEDNDISLISSLNPELVVIGTGKHLHFPDQDILFQFQRQGIGVEIMDTAAACRTYNFLIADGRNVVSALFSIEE